MQSYDTYETILVQLQGLAMPGKTALVLPQVTVLSMPCSLQHVKETAVPIPVAQERPAPRNEHFETWLPDEQQVWLLGSSVVGCFQKGGKLGTCWSARAACQLFLQKQQCNPDI